MADFVEGCTLCELSEQHERKVYPGRETLGIIFRTLVVNNSAELSFISTRKGLAQKG